MSRSSLVSVRSYERRRKSAGARLEGTQSQLLTLPPPAAAGGQHSAPSTKQLPIITEFRREKRVKSARETRREQEASDVFPELEKRKLDPNWWRTKYSDDFGPKVASPVQRRPVSPTRMNNPHPGKEFMVWKLPTRIHEHKRAVQPPPDIWRYLTERFYEDYWDNYNTGDMKNEVPVTNLAKIKFPGKTGKKDEGERPMIGISGKKAHLNPRQQSLRDDQEDSDSPDDGVRSAKTTTLRPPSPQSLMIHHTLKGSTLPVFKEWLKSATTREREVLLQMLQAAHDNSEEKRLNRVVSDVLQPESAERVHEWLKNTNDTERQIVLHVLETLALATGEADEPALMTYPAFYPHLQHRHHRHNTFPLSLRRGGSGGGGGGGGGGGHSHSCRHHTHRHHSCSKHRHTHSSRKSHTSSSSSSIPSESGFDSGSTIGLVGKKINRPDSTSRYDEKPELWQNRILKKKLGTKKTHVGGVFNQPHKDVGQHFSIHPEWPTA